MDQQYNVIDSIWFTPPVLSLLADSITIQTCIGIVAVESKDGDGEWKCYIGYGVTGDEDLDSQYIARRGMPLGNKEAACAFFPLDPEKIRY